MTADQATEILQALKAINSSLNIIGGALVFGVTLYALRWRAA